MCSGYTTPAIVLVLGPGGEEGQFADLSEPAGWRRQLLSSAGAEVCKQEDKMGAQNRDAGPAFSSTGPDVTSFLCLIQTDLVTARFRQGSIPGRLLPISRRIDFSATVWLSLLTCENILCVYVLKGPENKPRPGCFSSLL